MLQEKRKEVSGKEAISKAIEELKYYFEIQDKKVFLEKVEPTNNGWIIMLSYLEDETEREVLMDNIVKSNPFFATVSKQYVNIFLDTEGNFLKLKKANAPE
jgi:hypothetical protein